MYLKCGGPKVGVRVATTGDGYGGYSVGELELESGLELFICCGGKGSSSNGGYNGGGRGNSNVASYGGGGASHVALMDGMLKDLEGSKDKILIVAGGGGGAGGWSRSSKAGTWNVGGDGGGYIGGTGGLRNYTYAMGGTQTEGGTSNTSYGGKKGGFGCGADRHDSYPYAGGGGGGWFGGGSGMFLSSNVDGSTVYYGTGGGGGSGFLNARLNNKCMYSYNSSFTSSDVETKTLSCSDKSSVATEGLAKQGDGYARVTLID